MPEHGARRKVAVGIVDGAERVLTAEGAHCSQLDDRGRIPLSQQVFEPVDCRLETPCVGVGAPVDVESTRVMNRSGVGASTRQRGGFGQIR